VVAGWCAGDADAVINSDTSSVLYRPAEDAQNYTARLYIPCRLIGVHNGMPANYS